MGRRAPRVVATSPSVRVDLPARGEARVQVVGLRPGLERGSGRLELRLEVPGFLAQNLVLEL
jgi:hypothetical protein